MARRGRKESPKIETELLSSVASLMGRKDTFSLLQRGMRVHRKEELTKRCYLCKSQGSLDNQLIPRWISKETVVSICFGCYQRIDGWIKIDKPVEAWSFDMGLQINTTLAFEKYSPQTAWSKG